MQYTLVAAALGFGSAAYAESLAKTCPESDICYSLNIPESTASSGNGDIYFQITAPTSYTWVALGQGSQMAGSNIFVVYTSADGQNVTVSPRLGVGHVEPEHNSEAQITILGGSGVENGMMTANVKCNSCNTWSGGSMDFSSSSASWIHAYKTGEALNTDDVSADISRHDDASSFDWNMADAKGGNSVNPFVTTTGSGSTTSSTNNNNNTTSGSTTTMTSSSEAGVPFGGDFAFGDRVKIAHGVLASTAFIAFFPIGGILIRVANFTGLVWIHAAVQLLGYAVFIAAFGMGIYLAHEIDYLNNHHPIIGIVLFVVLFFQPFTGFLHHKLFKSYGGRTLWSYEHITIGRLAIILGIINGGLGIKLAGDVSNGYKVAYGICAGAMGLLYIGAMVYGEGKRRRNPNYDSSHRMEARELVSRDGSSNGRRHNEK